MKKKLKTNRINLYSVRSVVIVVDGNIPIRIGIPSPVEWPLVVQNFKSIKLK